MLQKTLPTPLAVVVPTEDLPSQQGMCAPEATKGRVGVAQELPRWPTEHGEYGGVHGGEPFVWVAAVEDDDRRGIGGYEFASKEAAGNVEDALDRLVSAGLKAFTCTWGRKKRSVHRSPW